MIIVSVAFKNGPAVGNKPRGINKEAIPYWKAVIKKFRKQIQSGTDMKMQWAIAISLFKTICSKKGVMPFDFETLEQKRKEDKEKLKRGKGDSSVINIYDKAKNSVKKAKKHINSLIRILKKDGYLDKILKSKWVFDRAVYADGRYHIGAYLRLRAGYESSTKELLQELALKYRFSKDLKSAFFSENDLATIHFEANPAKKPLDKKNQRILYAYLTLSFTKDQAEKVTLQEKGTKIESKLNKFGKGLLLM